MIDVCDGKYVGPMTVEELVEQYKYRAGIHLSYIELNKTDPAYEAYGTTQWHWWAINGYEEGIEKLLEIEPIYVEVNRCTTGEAIATLVRLLLKIFGGKK